MRSLDFVNGAAIQELDHDPPTPQPLKAPIDLAQIEARREALLRRKQSTPYCRQKSSLEKEPRVLFTEPVAASVSADGYPRWCG